MKGPGSDADAGAVLVTGAGGFVGGALCAALAASSRRVRRAVRANPPGASGAVAVGELGPATDWRSALEGVQCVVHLAARTHVLRETVADPLAEYRRVNVDATLRLAEQAREAGARRLVFMSSIKVNGEATRRPYTESDAPRPGDAYGVSKWEAEQALARAALASGLEIVVLRPPLLYGPQVRGNFLRLIELVARGTPLPLASIANRRSLLYVGNLADAVIAALDAPQAAGKTYLVSDGEDVSTPELVRALALALGVRPRLLPCPASVLHLASTLIGRRAEMRRLTGSLPVDSSAIRRELGWRPRYTLVRGLAETARWYHARASA
jgi:nucleoside-diphosphate-sugar epimerase